MAFNAFESIASSYSGTRKRLREKGLSTEPAPAPAPAPSPTPVREVRPPMAAPVQPVPAVATPTKLPEGVIAGLAALQERGMQHGVDTTQLDPKGDVITHLEDMNEAFDIMDEQKGSFIKQLSDGVANFFGFDDGVINTDSAFESVSAGARSVGEAAAQAVAEDPMLKHGLEGAQIVNDVGAGSLAVHTAPLMDQVARFPDIIAAQDEAAIMEALGRSTQYSDFMDNLDARQQAARENDIGLLEALKFESLRKAYQETEFHPLVRLGYDIAGDVTNLAAVTKAPIIGSKFLGQGDNIADDAMRAMLRKADDRLIDATNATARQQTHNLNQSMADELLGLGDAPQESDAVLRSPREGRFDRILPVGSADAAFDPDEIERYARLETEELPKFTEKETDEYFALKALDDQVTSSPTPAQQKLQKQGFLQGTMASRTDITLSAKGRELLDGYRSRIDPEYKPRERGGVTYEDLVEQAKIDEAADDFTPVKLTSRQRQLLEDETFSIFSVYQDSIYTGKGRGDLPEGAADFFDKHVSSDGELRLNKGIDGEDLPFVRRMNDDTIDKIDSWLVENDSDRNAVGAWGYWGEAKAALRAARNLQKKIGVSDRGVDAPLSRENVSPIEGTPAPDNFNELTRAQLAKEGLYEPPHYYQILKAINDSNKRGTGGISGYSQEELQPLRTAGLISPRKKVPTMTADGRSQFTDWDLQQKAYDARYGIVNDQMIDDAPVVRAPEPDISGNFSPPDFPNEIGDTVSNAGSLRFGEVVYIGDDPQPWKVDRVNGNLVDLDYIYRDVDSGGFVGLRAEKSHDISKTPLVRSGFDYKNEIIPPRDTFKRESLDIALTESILPEGGILGDDFGTAEPGTVVTIDGVETRIPQGGKTVKPNPATIDNEKLRIQKADDIEYDLANTPPDDIQGSEVGTNVTGSDPEGKALFLPTTADRVATTLTAADEEGWTYVARHDPTERGGSYVEILDETGERVDDVTNVIEQGDARFMVIDGERKLIGLDGQPYDRSAPAPPPEAIVVSKSPTAPAIKLTRLQRTHLKVNGEMLPSTNVKGSEAIAELRKAVDETLADLKMRDERSGGRSDRVTNRIASFNDLDAKLKEIEAEAPPPPDPEFVRQSVEITPEQKIVYEQQHAFTEDGKLTTVDSQATEGSEQFDSQRVQGEMDLPKTPEEWNAEDEIYEFAENETLDELPLFPAEYPDTPAGQSQKRIDELESEVDVLVGNKADDAEREAGEAAAEAEYLREIELERKANSEIAGWARVLLENRTTFPEEGLTPKQAWKISGLSEDGLPISGKSRITGKGKNKKIGQPRRIASDYYDAAEKRWGQDRLEGRPFYGPSQEANRLIRGTAAHAKAIRRKNWVVSLEAIDEINSDITAISPSYDPKVVGSDEALANIMRDVQDGKAAKIEYRQLIESRKAAEEANAAAIKEANEELADLRRKQILEELEDDTNRGTFVIDWNSGTQTNVETGEIVNDADILHKKNPVTKGKTNYVDSEGNSVSYEDALESDVLDVGAVAAQNISIQNPAAFSDPVVREQAERYIRDIRGPYSPEEVAALPDNELANLVAENISRQNPRRGTMSTGGQGVNPNAVATPTGSVDQVELGPPLDIAGNVQQSTQAEALFPEGRIKPSKLMPSQIMSEEEAWRAYTGSQYMPNPEVKSQVGAAGMRQAIEAGASRQEAEAVFTNNMVRDIKPTNEMKAAINDRQLHEIGSRAAERLDPGRIANTIDGGQSIGAATNSIIETTQRLDDAGRIWLDSAVRDWERLKDKYRIHSKVENEQLTELVEMISGNRAIEMTPAELLEARPSIRRKLIMEWHMLKPSDQERFIRAAQDTRVLLDNIRGFQNTVRANRGQKEIPWLADYMPHIREMGIWGKLGGVYEQSDIADRVMPDFTLPGKHFNPRELERKWRMGVDEREMSADKLIRAYLTTAQKDVFHTEIDRNIKANTKLWREASNDSYSLVNAADAFDTYSAEAYLGVPTKWSERIRSIPLLNRRVPGTLGLTKTDKALPSVIDASVLIRQGLTRSVFPLNWTWNSFVQMSSGLLTPVRYGVRNSIRAIDAITSKSVKDEIDAMSYVARTKGRRGNSVVLQNTAEDVYAFNSKLTWYERVSEWANFVSTQIEKNLTRHAIRTAYLRGEQMGYKGAELWQYASQGGARTQSMYNKADTVGVLRSREISAMVPFQTFAFEMFNTLAETNIPGLRKITGQLGAYESFSAKTAGGTATTYGRMKNIGIWLAGAVAINVVADRGSNRKPWNVSSFIPGWAILNGGVNGLGPGSAILPAKFVYDFFHAIRTYAKHGDARDLASIGLRYFGLPGGTQIDKSWRGAQAVSDGVVRNRNRTTKFTVDAPAMTGIDFDIPLIGNVSVTDAPINPEEYIKTYGQGIWSTNGGQKYLDEQLGRSETGRSLLGTVGAYLKESTGLDGLPSFGGKLGSINRKYRDTWDAYYGIPTDADERERRELPTRTTFRRKNPQVDARLFITGRVSSLLTGEARRIAKELIEEHDLLNPGGGLITGRAVDEELEANYRKELGDWWVDGKRGGQSNPVIPTLPDDQPLTPIAETEPQTSAQTSAEEKWRSVSAYLTRDNLVALQKIWDGEPISRTESRSLKAVFEKAPLGQTNFRKWSKQTLRQVHENAVVQSSREAVTV